MIVKTRRIALPELRRLQMAHPDFADSGWAICEIEGNEETVVDWYADRHVAEKEADRHAKETGARRC